MATADDFNHNEIMSGRLTMAEITVLVRFFQEAKGLNPDGKAGNLTQTEIDKLIPTQGITIPTGKWLTSPLPQLADGRRAQITSEFRPADRPDHDGIDLFYVWKPGDKPDFVGDHGAAGKAGKPPSWGVPIGTLALAAASGKVQLADKTKTGCRVWIDHGNGLRTGYFHLIDMRVTIGQVVDVGAVLGLIGDNPVDNDARHLHFELSPVDRYAPMDPTPYLKL